MLKFREGFTIFELLIAISILAILSALAIPDFRDLLGRNNEAVLQQQILQSIQLALQEAAIRGVPIYLALKNESLEVSSDVGLIALTQLNLGKGKLYSRAFPDYRNKIRFQPRRWHATDNGLFWYCRQHEDMPIFAVSMSNTALARVMRPNREGKIKDSRGRVLKCFS